MHQWGYRDKKKTARWQSEAGGRRRRGGRDPRARRRSPPSGAALLDWAQRATYERAARHHASPVARISRQIRRFLVAANHASHLDMGLVKHALGDWGPRLVALAAKDYFFDDPIKRAYFENFTNLVPMDRHGSLRESLRLASEVIKQGYILLIFPEGTRSTTRRDGRLQAVARLPRARQQGRRAADVSRRHARRDAQGQLPAAQRPREIAAHIGPLITHDELKRATEGVPQSGRLSRGVAARRAGGAQAGAAGEHQPWAGRAARPAS